MGLKRNGARRRYIAGEVNAWKSRVDNNGVTNGSAGRHCNHKATNQPLVMMQEFGETTA